MADLNAKDQARVLELERQVAEWRGALRFGNGISAVAIGGLLSGAASLIWLIVSAFVSSAAHSEKIKVFENQLAEQRKQFDAQLTEQRKKHDDLHMAHDQLRRNLVVLVDRQEKALPRLIETQVVLGVIQQLDAKFITVLPNDLGEPAQRIQLAEKVAARIKEKPATMQQIRVGMKAVVTLSQGKAVAIDAE